MEIAYCDNCGYQIPANDVSAGKAGVADYGKIYCAKCAPLFKFTTTALQKIVLPSNAIGDEVTGEFSAVKEPVPAGQSETKFYFCEKCGKRITDKEIELGLGRDKKLKGVYCKQCAVGVMTIDFAAVKVAPHKTPAHLPKAQSTQTPPASVAKKGSAFGLAPAAPTSGAKKGSAFGIPAATPASSTKKGSAFNIAAASRLSTQPHDKPSERILAHGNRTARRGERQGVPAVAITLAVVAVLLVIVLVFTSGDNGTRSAQTRPTNKSGEQAVSPLPEPAPIAPKPRDSLISKPLPEKPQPPPPVAAPQNPDPEILAKADFDKLVKFEGLGDDDTAGQIAAVETFLKKHGESTFAEAARVLMRTLKKSLPAQPAPIAQTTEPAAKPVAPAMDTPRKEKSDLAEIQALRQRAIDALRAKAGATVTLTLRGTKMTGTVKDDPAHNDLALALRDGPEMTIKADQLDAQDVDSFAPVETGENKAIDLRRRGLLFLAAGETAKAEAYLIQARDAGLGNAIAPDLERIAAVKLNDKESVALEAWKKAEGLFSKKNWKEARQSYQTFQREHARSAALASNAETLKKRLETIDEALGPISLDMGGGVKMELMLIPAGEFEMGSNDGGKNEKPVHKVKISGPFHMGKYVVTQAQYEKVMGNNPSHFKDENLPVETVTYIDAEEFCKKVSKITGKPIRLPTEAEWEYACRAGTKTKFNTGDNDAALEQAGWFVGNSNNKTHPVGQKNPNAWGLYDMHGNVWQWCEDWYEEDFYVKSDAENPHGPANGSHRTARSGSFGGSSGDCRSALRYYFVPSDYGRSIGFRVVVAPASSKP